MPAFAQLSGTIGFDLVPGDPHFDGGVGGTATVDPDSDIDTSLSVAPNAVFKTLVRVNGAENLLGVTFDFGFNASVLQVDAIRETLLDLNFSGTQEFKEINDSINFFLAGAMSGDPSVDGFMYSYNDGTGDITTEPGILLDWENNDGNFDFKEINEAINQFIRIANTTETPFWTQVVAARGGFNESVEIFDTAAEINAAGQATDNTSVLLRRPDTPAAGFGFDSATLGSAIILEVSFRAVGGAGTSSDITISNAQGIDENFADVNTDIQSLAVTGPSTVSVN
jgi:hypothetical protein